ncbi:hypothetical protein FPV67DRAFT_926593 [Lyophyllum atratum]|nr:hypothetical protein FPV67DRAFT_926593 [Lyophyllum atratum]
MMESPFTDRLNTCYHATDAEVPKIRQIIADLLKERKRIEDRIELFEVLIKDLYPQWDKIDEHIEDHRALIGGIHQLPVELIRTIFCWCLPPRNSAMSSKDAPLVLSRVCSTWRQISLSTPQLWTSLHIQVPVIRKKGERDLLVRYGEAVTAWLKRSASLPISLSFVEEEFPFLPASSTSTPGFYLLEILLGFSDRWNHLNFKVFYSSIGPFARLKEHDVPFLKTAQIEIINPPHDSVADLSPFTFLRSPSLRNVFLWNYTSRDSPLVLPLQWKALTTFVLTSRGRYRAACLSVDEALTTLNECLSLVTCILHIQLNPIDSLMQPNRALVRLRHLRELGIKLQVPMHLVGGEQIKTFFQILDLPELRLLELTGAQKIHQLPFVPLLSRQHKIDTMAFDVEASTVQDLVECLHMTPSLKRLYVNSSFTNRPDPWGVYSDMPPVSDEDGLEEGLPENPVPSLSTTFLTRLIPTPSMTEIIVCPLLEDIEFRFPENSDVTDDCILRFILSRTILAPQGITRLARAHITFQRDMQRDIHADLAPAIQMGLDLHLGYDNPADHAPNIYPTFSPLRNIEISAFPPDESFSPRFFDISW